MAHYQPLSWLTFSLDFTIRGANPTGYHLTNLLLHTVNAVVFFFVAGLLLTYAFRLADARRNSARDFAAALAALIFSIHPLRVESVARATERRDVLSGCFFLLTLYGYLRYQDNPAQERRGQGFLIRFRVFSFACGQGDGNYDADCFAPARYLSIAPLVEADRYSYLRIGGPLTLWHHHSSFHHGVSYRKNNEP